MVALADDVEAAAVEGCERAAMPDRDDCRVRQALLSGDPASANLTQLALQWGFFHYGRFAQYYGERFGERPQDTLRRSA